MSSLIGVLVAAAASLAPLTQPGLSNSAAPPAQSACRGRQACRHIETYSLVTAPGQTSTITIGSDFDYFYNDALRLIPGESVMLEADLSGPAPKLAFKAAGAVGPSLTAMADYVAVGGTGKAPELRVSPNGLVISALQATARPDTYLFFQNGYAKPVTFKVTGLPPTGGSASLTCKVAASGIAIQHWTGAIAEVNVEAFGLADSADNLGCH